jgi:hypothetical protein
MRRLLTCACVVAAVGVPVSAALAHSIQSPNNGGRASGTFTTKITYQ